MRTQGQVIEIIYKVFPYSKQITDLNLENRPFVQFHWRGDTFRVDVKNLSVSNIDGDFVVGKNVALLAEALLEAYSG